MVFSLVVLTMWYGSIPEGEYKWEFDSPRGYSGTARGPQKFSTADQARIEIVIDRRMNADALEGWMGGI